MSKKILIVDDSALVRKQLKDIVSVLDFDIEFAKNGLEAVNKVTSKQYDVVTLDINMPVMNGLDALKIIMQKQPTAVLLISSLTTENASVTIEALEVGAIDFIAKPGTMNVGKVENAQEILDKIKYASNISARRLRKLSNSNYLNRKRVVTKKEPISSLESRAIEKIVLVGASTGGPRLIEQICASLPVNYPYPVCIVQHMPANFISSFVERLKRVSVLEVYETQSNMEILPGNIYIAKGGVHLNFIKKASGKIVALETQSKVDDFFIPSINEMMNSALDVFIASKIVAVILTGIGDDGANSMVSIKNAGGFTLAESQESAIIYGMPKVAYEKGGVSMQLDFQQILKYIITLR